MLQLLTVLWPVWIYILIGYLIIIVLRVTEWYGTYEEDAPVPLCGFVWPVFLAIVIIYWVFSFPDWIAKFIRKWWKSFILKQFNRLDRYS